MEEQLAVDICWGTFAEWSFGEPLQKMYTSATVSWEDFPPSSTRPSPTLNFTSSFLIRPVTKAGYLVD